MIDAKLKGEGIDLEFEAPVARDTNVIDLMAALKNSLGQLPAEKAAPPKRKKAAEDVRQQPGLKLPIAGGKSATADGQDIGTQAATKPSRRRAG